MNSPQVRIDEYERYHAKRRVLPSVTPSFKELSLTFIIAMLLTPFFFVTFFVLPMMGQITVGVAAIITAIYLVARRSILVTLASLGGVVFFSAVTFATIQAIKYRVDIPIFIFLVMGVPITTIYCIFVGTRIWVLRGGDV